MLRAVVELRNARDAVALVQRRNRNDTPAPRTLGDRIIGSMWNPRDPKEQDSVALTVSSIHRFLNIA